MDFPALIRNVTTLRGVPCGAAQGESGRVPSPSQRPPPGSTGTESESISWSRDSAEIYRLSFDRTRAEIDLTRLPPGIAPVVLRLVHAVGDPSPMTQSSLTKPCG
jgi:hypothetical protein